MKRENLKHILKLMAAIFCLIVSVPVVIYAESMIEEIIENDNEAYFIEPEDIDGSEDVMDEADWTSYVPEYEDEEVAYQATEEQCYVDEQTPNESELEPSNSFSEDETDGTSGAESIGTESIIEQLIPLKCCFGFYTCIDYKKTFIPSVDEEVQVVWESSDGTVANMNIVFTKEEFIEAVNEGKTHWGTETCCEKNTTLIKEFDSPGTYIYTIKEEGPNSDGYIYDEASYSLVVYVTESNNTLSAEVYFDNNEVAVSIDQESGLASCSLLVEEKKTLFENRFAPNPEKIKKPISIWNEIHLAHDYSQYVFSNDTFEFTLYRLDNSGVKYATGTCVQKGNGHADFTKLGSKSSVFSYSAPGTYTYYVKETRCHIGYKMDTSEWKLITTITYADGALHEDSKWIKDGVEYDQCTFVNTFINGDVSGIKDKVYNGKPQTQVPVVKFNGWTLTCDRSYSLSYSNNTNAGKATVIITGSEDYPGKISRYFTIKPASLANADITGITSKVYNGSALSQTPVVKLNGKTLKLNTDYYLAYKNNINTGRATIAIKGKGNYNNVAVRYFAINPKPSWIASLSSPKTKQIKITWGKRTQISGYQLEISTNKSFAKPKMQKNVYDPAKLSMTVSVAKANTTYYVRIRSFKKTSDKTYFSAWSAVKTVKTK